MPTYSFNVELEIWKRNLRFRLLWEESLRGVLDAFWSLEDWEEGPLLFLRMGCHLCRRGYENSLEPPELPTVVAMAAAEIALARSVMDDYDCLHLGRLLKEDPPEFLALWELALVAG